MLQNIKILDLSRVLSGPYCSRMLADMGADVIKIESTGGDAMRYYPPFKGKYSSYFTQWNMGKKSVCIDAFLEIIGEWAKDVTIEEAAALFEKHDIPYAKVHSNQEILNSQVVKDRQMLVDMDLPEVGSVPVVNTPFKFSAVSTGPMGPPPSLGQHNHAVLKDIACFTDIEIKDMEQAGIIKKDG